MALVLVAPPEGEPIALQAVKDHCRVDHTAEDALFPGMIAAAREHAETVLRRSLLPRTYELVLHHFPRGAIRLPRPPLRAVESIRYTDAGGNQLLLDPSAYQVDADEEPGRVLPVGGWPAVRPGPGAVRIRFVAGYADHGDPPAPLIPAGIRMAMLLLVGHWYAHRESVVVGSLSSSVEMTFDVLVWPHRFLGEADL